jgi:hypothetical protein
MKSRRAFSLRTIVGTALALGAGLPLTLLACMPGFPLHHTPAAQGLRCSVPCFRQVEARSIDLSVLDEIDVPFDLDSRMDNDKKASFVASIQCQCHCFCHCTCHCWCAC